MITSQSEITMQKTPENYSLGRLFKRARTILRKEPRGKGRISRGEFFVSSLLLNTITTIVALVISFFSYLGSGIISTIFGLRSIGLLFRRAHDFGKSKRFVLIPLFGLIIVGIAWFFSSVGMWMINIMTANNFMTTNIVYAQFQKPSLGIENVDSYQNTFNPYTNPDNSFNDTYQPAHQESLMSLIKGPMNRVLGILAIILLLWYAYLIISLLFKKGTTGDNRFGSDPLLLQPQNDGLYRGASVLLLIGNFIVGVLLSFLGSVLPIGGNSMNEGFEDNQREQYNSLDNTDGLLEPTQQGGSDTDTLNNTDNQKSVINSNPSDNEPTILDGIPSDANNTVSGTNEDMGINNQPTPQLENPIPEELIQPEPQPEMSATEKAILELRRRKIERGELVE